MSGPMRGSGHTVVTQTVVGPALRALVGEAVNLK